MKISHSIVFFIFLLKPILIFPQQQYAKLGDFLLESGEIVYDCKISYRTFGKLNSDSSNAILFPTWFGGTSEMLKNLISNGEDKLLDSTQYFIIAVDALGNGVSTSPSNSLKQLNEKFPRFNIRDIVNSQYELVKRILGLKKLHAAIGGSMGGMQVLQLAVSYPDFVKKVVAYVPTPWSSSYDKLLWSTREQLILSAKKCEMSEREIFKLINMLTQLVARTPDWFVTNNPAEKFDEYLKTFDKAAPSHWTSYDYLYQLNAMINHDISKGFQNRVDLRNHIKAELFLIIAKNDHILHPSTSLELSEIINARTLILENDCGHLAVNCEIDFVREQLKSFLNK